MIDLLGLLFINSFLIIGIRMSVDYDKADIHGEDDIDRNGIVKNSKMIFWKISFYGQKHLPSWVYKPLFLCPICMSSIHSVYIYWGVYDFTGYNMVVYACYVFALTGLNTYIWNNITFD